MIPNAELSLPQTLPVSAQLDPPDNHDFDAVDDMTASAFRALRDEVAEAMPAPSAANGSFDTPAAAAERLRLTREILRLYGKQYLKGRDANFEND